MSVLIGCIADDFTGATDLAGTMVREGMRSVRTIGVPTDPPPDVDAVFLLANHGPVVAGKSRGAGVYASEEVEETANRHLLLHAKNLRVLTDEQVEELERTFPRD